MLHLRGTRLRRLSHGRLLFQRPFSYQRKGRKHALVPHLAKLRGVNHYQIRLLQIGRLLLKNDSLFSENRYSHEQAAILRETFSAILSGEGFDEVERGE